MSRPVSLATLRSRVRAAGDFGPDTTTGRYPNARLNTQINASWQRQRAIATTKGDGTIYLKHTTPTAMTTGTLDAATSFGTVPYPADAVAIHGIDVVFSSLDIIALEAASFADRNIFRDIYGGPTGRPVAFCIINTGVENNTTVTQGTIAIYPAPDSAYVYTIWYVPAWTDINTDANVFDGIEGWDDWTVWDSVIQIASGDNDSQAVVQIAMHERDKAEAMITTRANSMQRVGPTRRRDVRAYSRRNRMLYWRRPQ